MSIRPSGRVVLASIPLPPPRAPIRPSGRIVLGAIPLAVCVHRIAENATQIVRVNVSECCVKDIRPCVVQGAAKVFQFVDAETVDYGDATEITFDVWQRNIGGTNILTKSLSGASIVIADTNIFQFTLGNTESAALAAGAHHCEAWVTTSTGDRRCVGLGTFTVTDARKHD